MKQELLCLLRRQLARLSLILMTGTTLAYLARTAGHNLPEFYGRPDASMHHDTDPDAQLRRWVHNSGIHE
jgi:hypothetical protein